MITTPLNQRTVSMKLTRIEVCDLLLACTAVSGACADDGHPAQKWDALHDKLKAILEDFDKKQGF